MNRPDPATPLTAAQRDELGARLRERQRKLRADVAAKLRTQEDPHLVGLRNRMEDTDDWAAADAMAAQDIALVSHDLAELTEVERALSRLADGSYGECIDCGKPIPHARLYAYPTATRCVACQQQRETVARRSGTSPG
ncbi:MAG TPA: TraR/DksA C4-type zinc finger protein [Casimicrobiaceae bacterium]|nr:TraR/DksA C4-type zinc finger protein [Casimicrobiaceae bacterium]